MNRDFFMVFEIKGNSLLSKVCILGVLTLGKLEAGVLNVVLIKVNSLNLLIMRHLIWMVLFIDCFCHLVARPSLFLRTGPSIAGYPSLGQRTSSLGENAPLPGF